MRSFLLPCSPAPLRSAANSVFETLSDHNDTALAAGRLPGQAEWRFVDPAVDYSISINIEATLGINIGQLKREVD